MNAAAPTVRVEDAPERMLKSGAPAYKFTDADRRKAVEASLASRQRNTAERDAFIDLVRTLAEGLTAESTGALALAVTWEMGTRALSDEMSPLDQARYAQAAETWHKIYRLATNQATSNVAHATLDPAEQVERVAQLRTRMAQLDNTPEHDDTRTAEAESHNTDEDATPNPAE